MGLSIIRYGPFRSGCNVLEIPFHVVNLRIEKYVPTFNFVAGVNREFIWELIFCFVIVFCYFLLNIVVFFVSVVD